MFGGLPILVQSGEINFVLFCYHPDGSFSLSCVVCTVLSSLDMLFTSSFFFVAVFFLFSCFLSWLWVHYFVNILYLLLFIFCHYQSSSSVPVVWAGFVLHADVSFLVASLLCFDCWPELAVSGCCQSLQSLHLPFLILMKWLCVFFICFFSLLGDVCFLMFCLVFSILASSCVCCCFLGYLLHLFLY